MVGQFAVTARLCVYVFPRIRHWLLLYLFLLPKVTNRLLKNATSWWVLPCFLRIASECSTSPKKTEPAIVLWKVLHHQRWCTILQFHCRQKLLVIIHYSKSFKWMRSNQNTGKCIKTYKNFSREFVVEQNLTRPKGDFWSYLNRPYRIVVVWDDWVTGNMDPVTLPLISIIHYYNGSN